MATVESFSETTYSFKNGEYVTVRRLFNDIIHPGTGGVMNRWMKDVIITGNVSDEVKEEMKNWILSKCKYPVPKILMKYIKENQ